MTIGQCDPSCMGKARGTQADSGDDDMDVEELMVRLQHPENRLAQKVV